MSILVNSMTTAQQRRKRRRFPTAASVFQTTGGKHEADCTGNCCACFQQPASNGIQSNEITNPRSNMLRRNLHLQQYHKYRHLYLDNGFDDCSQPDFRHVIASQPGNQYGDLAACGDVFSRQQIREHNKKVGWQQWITLKGVVYHTNGFRDHFIAYNRRKSSEWKQEQVNGTATTSSNEAKEKTEDKDNAGQTMAKTDKFVGDKEDGCSNHEKGVGKRKNNSKYKEDEKNYREFLWHFDVIGALRKSGLCMAEIESEIEPFKIGTLDRTTVSSWKCWQNIRTEVIALHDDISSKSSEEMSEYERQYLQVLQRWLRKYIDMDPVEKHPSGDGNTKNFLVEQDPESLREWIPTYTPLYFDIPESGAWCQIEQSVLPSLGDTHSVFLASLRSHFSSEEYHLHFDIDGDVAWREMPLNVIAEDELTMDQDAIYHARLGRSPTLQSMERRRKVLADYFRKGYGYSEDKIAPFLKWGDVMVENEKQLHALLPVDLEKDD